MPGLVHDPEAEGRAEVKYEIDPERYEGLTGRALKEALWELYERAYEEGKAESELATEDDFIDGKSEGYDEGYEDGYQDALTKLRLVDNDTASNAELLQQLRAIIWPVGHPKGS